jgi:hypothetical protein
MRKLHNRGKKKQGKREYVKMCVTFPFDQRGS